MSPEKIPWEVYEAEFVTSAVRRSGYPDDELPCVALPDARTWESPSFTAWPAANPRQDQTDPGLTQLGTSTDQ
jgi:hypothetical protein